MEILQVVGFAALAAFMVWRWAVDFRDYARRFKRSRRTRLLTGATVAAVVLGSSLGGVVVRVGRNAGWGDEIANRAGVAALAVTLGALGLVTFRVTWWADFVERRRLATGAACSGCTRPVVWRKFVRPQVGSPSLPSETHWMYVCQCDTWTLFTAGAPPKRLTRMPAQTP